MMFKRSVVFCMVFAAAAALVSCKHGRSPVIQPLAKMEAPKKVSPRAEAFSRFLTATMYERSGDLDRAIEEMRAAADIDPTSSVLTLRLVRAYVRNEDFENAREMAERAIKQMPDNANLWIVLGEIYHQQEEYDKAVECFSKAIELDPENVLGYGALVSVEEKTNDLVAALDVYQRLVDITPNSAGVQFQLGMSLVRIDDNQAAKPHLEKALELNPALTRTHLLLGAIELELDNPEKAARHLEAYLDAVAMPTADQAREHLAAAYWRLGETDKALEQLALLADSEMAEPRHGLERMYLLVRAGRNQEALEVVPPADTPVLGAFFRALARKNLGEPYKEAFQALDTTDGYIDEEINAFLSELLYLYGKKDTGDYLVETLKGLRQDGVKSDVVDLLLGRTLMGLDRYADAEPVLLASLERPGLEKPAHYYLATVYENLERIEGVEKHLQACLQLDPEDAETMNFLGYMYAVNKIKLDEAEALLNKALEIEPDNGYFMDSLAWVYYQRGEADKALDLMRKAILAAESDDAELRDHLGDIYLLKGDKEKAVAEWKRARRLNPKLEGVQEKLDKHAEN